MRLMIGGRSMRIKPLRILAAALLLVVGVEIWGITHVPTYETELAAAKAAYNDALRENRMLIDELTK